MNIAILIGISEYKILSRLPACASDIDHMQELLSATNKYTDVFTIKHDTDAASVKDKVRSFLGGYIGKGPIREALIYFSGHGVYHNNDALLCCTDFDPNKPASTSISNSELDDLLRNLSPSVSVKIIDACQSGSPYIKDAGISFEKAIKSSQLNSFICMASSKFDQSSYATSDCSMFTQELVKAALSIPHGKILYRDIQAAIADAFVKTPEQTPFFVNQGTGLEEFSLVTDDINKIKNKLSHQRPTQSKKSKINLIEAKVHDQDSLFVPLEMAHGAVINISEEIPGTKLKDEITSHFYEVKAEALPDLSRLPKAKSLATYASEQSWEKRFFIKIKTEPYTERVPKNPMHALLGSSIGFLNKLSDSDYVEQTRYRPSLIEPTASLPISTIEIVFESKNHPSLKSFIAYIAFIHSRTELMALSAITSFNSIGWDGRKINTQDLQWKNTPYYWKDIVSNPRSIYIDQLGEFESKIKDYLESLLPPEEDNKTTELAAPETNKP